MLYESKKVFKAMAKNDVKTTIFDGKKVINNTINKIKIIEILNIEEVFKNIIDRINKYNKEKISKSISDNHYNFGMTPIDKTVINFEDYIFLFSDSGDVLYKDVTSEIQTKYANNRHIEYFSETISSAWKIVKNSKKFLWGFLGTSSGFSLLWLYIDHWDKISNVWNYLKTVF